MHHAGLVPAHGDGALFVQSGEPLASFGMGRQGLRVAALKQSDGPKLAFAHGNTAGVAALLAKLDGNDELDSLLENILQNTEELKTVQTQANAGAEAPADAA